MTKTILLTQGYVALVDDEFYEELNKHKWCFKRNRYGGYAKRALPSINGKSRQILMHHVICDLAGKSRGDETDHKNGNGLDNRLDNLRPATKSQNQHNRRLQKNTSGYKGVSLHGMTGRWQANIQLNGIQKYLGLFNTPEEAAQVYAKAASELHKEFACLG